MKKIIIVILLLTMLLLTVKSVRAAEIHNAAKKGDLARVKALLDPKNAFTIL